ncbi:putative heterokaryon incompatibility protein het-6-like protein [Botrytis fragariae]|uniref:Putative heterokaryon incompatibility protein het-6-like protein n=1 Tax=Botrytis fragariae TaxID=1964551 RepID=A0A8H6AWG9_9HELO|nr:putative heterokaryon incompatibility protein het-6-like protein [Botrytis fragariae]KAF5874991.1 putative heterokaryon incompatibility protein het-6-like protein [Botrytis fragariae]
MGQDNRDQQIPPNDPKTPRWLLDLHDWKLKRYVDIASTIETEGYGIVSYTWGYIADLKKPQPDDKLPGGLLWDVPTTSAFSLDPAREVMAKIGTRYVWWDWMCVPQETLNGRRTITDSLRSAGHEEIGKQLNIYRNAKKSIVWLHSTDWSLQSPLKTLLLAGSKDNGALPTEPKAYFDKVVQLLTESRKLERWFVSGWTLQEGVLLPETILIDGASNALQHDTFMHNGGHASVIDLTARVTKLAVEVAQSFLLQANGKEPQNQVGMLIDESAHRADEFRQILRALVTSGLVAYSKASPLYILSGKQSRKFGMEQDSCWALIGAMELEGVTVNYNLPMDEIKMMFLRALFKKYQWSMLLLPQPLLSVNEGQSASNFKWVNIVDGLLIPVGVFVDSQIGLASKSMLPSIALDNAMTVTVQPPKTSQTFTLWKNLDIKWYLHYVQTEAGVEIRSLASKTSPTPRISDAVFLKLEDLGKNDKAAAESTGMRCAAIMEFGTSQVKESAGVFGGIVDLWFVGGSKVEVPSLKLHSSAH